MLEPQKALGKLGWMRGALGAAFATLGAGAITLIALGDVAPGLPWLVAPLGASAVLVFSVPASPLAQPWPLVGGTVLSGLIGIGIGQLTGHPLLAAGIAVGLAIMLMSLTRSLHPPGGACALLCALGAAGPEAWGYAHLAAVVLNMLALAAAAWAYNSLTGHAWPHRAEPLPPLPADAVVHYERAELEALLAEWDEVVDIDVDDLDALFRAFSRRLAENGRRPNFGQG
ncbi:HPP family protein [Sandaracinobacteroides sp. A072]|uniref:HPP family protein n=1 Tax=Sandaracinobacteroides sp. A072 TaxID=3461146 RepID=UPI00404236F7